MKLNLVIVFISLGFVGCTSLTVSVSSVPEKAKVSVRPVGGGELVEMGETPVVIVDSQLQAADASSGPIYLEVSKEGYKTEKVVITETSGVEVNLDLALKADEKQLMDGLNSKVRDIEDARKLNLAIDRLFEVKKFVDLESYSEALIHLRNIESDYPYLSATYELKGGILFLQKKFRDALAAYSLALKYNPKSVASSQMKELLKKKLGIESLDDDGPSLERAPASKVKKKKKRKKRRKKRVRRRKKQESNGL